MKLQHIILALAATAMLATSCEEKQVLPGDPAPNQLDSLENNRIVVTCAQAAEIALALEADNVATSEVYDITGYVQSAGYSDEISRGQQKWFWVADEPNGGKVFEAYWCNVPNAQAVPIGAKVKLIGTLMKYKTTPEMKNGKVYILEAPAE